MATLYQATTLSKYAQAGAWYVWGPIAEVNQAVDHFQATSAKAVIVYDIKCHNNRMVKITL